MQFLRCSSRWFTSSLLHNYRPVPLKHNLPKRCFSGKSLDVNTNVVKDVILYKYINERFYKLMNICAICQLVFWSYLASFSFKHVQELPADRIGANRWWLKLNHSDNIYKYGFSALSVIVGWGITSVIWMYSMRSVKYLVLHKGGKQLTIVTYGPFGKNRMLTLGLENVSSKQNRNAATSFIPLKVKGHYFHYLVDMRGEFKNATLFDHTAGLHRKWNN